MIAFGAAMTDPEAYRRFAAPGIEASVEPDSEIYSFAAVGSICRSYNVVLDAAASSTDLEALVLVDQAVELVDPDICAKVRAALADPGVGVVGCAGSTGARSIAWWEGRINAAPVRHRYREFGGGEVPAFSWAEVDPPPAEVETLAGFLLVFSPWAVRNVRFDETLHLGHGYDLDYCTRVREAGRKVMTADLAVVDHSSLELVDDRDLWIEAHIEAAARLAGRVPGVGLAEGQTWKQRARVAEAECEAARTIAYSNSSRLDAELQPLQQCLDEMTDSLSWRVTEPLRWVNRIRAGMARRRS